jgi:predicted phage replisome organizer
MANEVKWIKLTTDMFDNRKIKHLRRLPDGNNIVLIWVMLLTMAGRCNSSGMIFLTENIPYTPKMLADELDFEETTVQLALTALEQLNMIVTDRGFFSIAGWDEYQNIEGMEKIREQNRLRKQRQREKEKLLLCDNHVTSRDSHATDIEEDKEEEKDKEDLSKDKSKRKPAKHKHGEFQHVLLTDNEYESLANTYGVQMRDQAIAFLDAYIEEKGYKSKSHNLAIRRWVIDAVNDQQRKGQPVRRKEPVPQWCTNDDMRSYLHDFDKKTAANDPDIAARAERLKRQFDGGD